MYGIYANIGGILMVNVTIYGIHGSYGVWFVKINEQRLVCISRQKFGCLHWLKLSPKTLPSPQLTAAPVYLTIPYRVHIWCSGNLFLWEWCSWPALQWLGLDGSGFLGGWGGVQSFWALSPAFHPFHRDSGSSLQGTHLIHPLLAVKILQ